MAERSLLPARASTKFLRDFEQATAYEPRVSQSIDLIRDVKGRKLPDWLAFLLFEYGLIELTPYVESPYTLIDDGREWQIERDTWAAIARGLGWVSSPATIVEAPARREWWNSFQLYFDGLPPADVPNLSRIEKIVGLSKPFRSDFRRGVFGYDAPAFEGDTTRLDASLLDAESGVRLRPGGALWSFGRATEYTHTLTEAEGVALGNWQELPSEQEFLLDFVNWSGVVDDEPVLPQTLFAFERYSRKYHRNAAGVWQLFQSGELALTDRSLSIEGAATRHTLLAPDFNALDDPDAAVVLAVGVADPFGGNGAIRVGFNSEAGRTFLVPAGGLVAGTTYKVSFFAKLISSSGVSPAGADATLKDVFSQLVVGQWVRVEGVPFTPSEVAGQWIDLTLTGPGATMTVELFGFQAEEGTVMTSPVPGSEIVDYRDADSLSIILPSGRTDLTFAFPDGRFQSFSGLSGLFAVNPAGMSSSEILFVTNAIANSWEALTIPWDDAVFPWISDAYVQREIALASWFEGRVAYFELKNAAGAVIGFRRARVVRQVAEVLQGDFRFGTARYAASQGGRSVYIEAMTDAGNGAGQVVKASAIVFGAVLAPGTPPGALWLPPGGIVSGARVAPGNIDIPLRATVRDRIKTLLRF